MSSVSVSFPGAGRWQTYAVLATAAFSGMIAAAIAAAGTKGAVVALAAAVLAAGMVLVRNRERFVLVAMVVGMQFMLHKSFGPIDETVASGASALYVTSLDVLVALLYGLWFLDGTFKEDIARAMSRRVALISLLPIILSIPSFLAAANVLDAFAELVRMAWMFGLFLYVAARIRTRRDIGWVVGAVFLVALVQAVIVVAQWRSGGTLGLSFLGEETGVFVRSIDEGDVLRPSGTAIHPDLLAALVGPIALLGLALAIEVRVWRARALFLMCSLVAYVPLALSQTRAASVAVGVATVLLLIAYVWKRRIPGRVVFAAGVIGAVCAVYFWPQVQAQIFDNFQTDHFRLEVDARMELNGIALAMMGDHPLFGVGLNNFMAVFDSYDLYGVIYPGFPVHNLYLLVFAETGILGFVGLMAVVVLFTAISIRLAFARDRFLGAIGVGLVASFVFFGVEELLSYSLRGDIPSALFWLLAGLAVACARLASASPTDEADAS